MPAYAELRLDLMQQKHQPSALLTKLATVQLCGTASSKQLWAKFWFCSHHKPKAQHCKSSRGARTHAILWHLFLKPTDAASATVPYCILQVFEQHDDNHTA